ncbi:arrestin domain-containing protein 3-like [Pristis pectinata]|uniref:arrestin domain-containing protein 3-like n=1 Tax=Pristis pectinata TaxID=685728 RepID=UPI00223E73C2|nr:arrestin domain-containing protein 3-like [Pristis pectinata]XP_051876189.1 arrestin domain-containing protein 3-like [Pristis pectinata]XP_051876190.1 arrestin domain-containing protein 3-like [Pristis pectinata]
MGRVKTFAILYDRPTYSCGEWVTGRIVLELTDQTEVKALKIHAKGQAYVHWTESDSSSESNQSRDYTQELRYFKHKHLLIGTESSDEVTVLQSGRHEYPFSLVLPTMPPLPSSFKGAHGHVSYWMTAKLHRPWKLRTKVKEIFTVFNQIDNNAPGLLEPLMVTDEKTICCWCCASGPVLLNAKIERKGFIAGDSIQIFAEIENHSSRKVVPTAAIFKTITYHAKTKKRSSAELVTKIEGEPVLAGQKDSRNVMLLKIPETPPTLMNCTIIQMEYSIKVSVEIPRAMNLTVSLPIVIGTIPSHSFGAPASDFGIQYGMDYGNVNQTHPDKPEVAAGFLVNNKNIGFCT